MKTNQLQVELSHHRKERLVLKLSLGGLTGFILLIAVCWAGRGIYVRWQERRLVRTAMFAIERGDDRTARLAARNVLNLKPSSVGAARVMAQVGEHAGERMALDWRRKVAELLPHSVEDGLAWARSALQFHDGATARRALARLDESAKHTAGYHAVAAQLAQLAHDDQGADAEWSEAVRLDPAEKSYELQLGIIRLGAANQTRRASGEQILNGLRDIPQKRVFATRALISQGITQRQDPQHLLELARELQAYPEATPTDRLIFLDMLHQLKQPEFSSYLETIEKTFAANPNQLGALLAWMSKNKLNLLALDYLRSFPSTELQKWPLPFSIAHIYAQLKDWPKLESVARNGNWREFEFLRHAFLARAFRAQDQVAAADREWATAVKTASAQSASTLLLVETASEWGWESETVDLLWTLAKYPEKQTEALHTLYRHYSQTGDTQGLYRVLVRLSELDPGNLDVQNNLAQISLLLNTQSDVSRRMAADVYRKNPSNPAYAATYAYSLLTKGDAETAGKIMNSMAEDQLRNPPISAYYGICLAALKDARAREFLDAGRKAALLPEEKALIDKALADLGPTSKRP